MSTENQPSMEEQLALLQKQTKCPLAEGQLIIFMQAMDPYRRRRIALECPAKRRVVSNPMEWKVFEEDIRKLCCNPKYATVCEWYKKAKIES